ncbi:hypothetical protein CJF31_00010805 [Rutstroemia sp. NJR-2017a BVV2]|nr:hypothetical protein CJF31_00010805 [Rutstroemia sp. NJR-2017a BVV2]
MASLAVKIPNVERPKVSKGTRAKAAPALIANRKQLKPQRNMTHPHRESKAHSHRSRSKKRQPLDPEDLSRRLALHLSEQRRVARARATEEHVPYHHVPQVAAVDFESTATPEKMGQIHKLAQPALKSLEILRFGEKPATPLQNPKAMNLATVDRHHVRNRNQHRWTTALERAAELDDERDIYRFPRRTFETEISSSVHRTRQMSRPLSLGDMLWEREAENPEERKRDRNDRQDWSQRDEDEVKVRRKMRDLVTPLLALTTKKSKGQENGTIMAVGLVAAKEGRNVRSASFLARFRRRALS